MGRSGGADRRGARSGRRLPLPPARRRGRAGAIQSPKVESYGGYLYLILHGIDFKAASTRFATRDVDFFLGRNYLVTVHDGRRDRSSSCARSAAARPHVLGEGPVALLHRIVDSMVDNYRPEVEELEERLDELEERACSRPLQDAGRGRSSSSSATWRRCAGVMPQRDAIGRLARREFPMISDEMAYRFRDVYDHLVRLTDEAMFCSRTGSPASSKRTCRRLEPAEPGDEGADGDVDDLPAADRADRHVGMNVPLPHLPGGPTRSSGGSAASWRRSCSSVMLVAFFRRERWI